MLIFGFLYETSTRPNQSFNNQISDISRQFQETVRSESLSEWLNELGVSHQYIDSKIPIHRKRFIDEQGSLTLEAKKFAAFLLGKKWDLISEESRKAVTKIISSHQGDFIYHSGNVLIQKGVVA